MTTPVPISRPELQAMLDAMPVGWRNDDAVAFIERAERALADAEAPSDTLVRIDALAALTPGWDTYDGKPITPAAIETAKRIVGRLEAAAGWPPAVVPVSVGGVQLEWHDDGVDVEIEVRPDGTWEAWGEGPGEPSGATGTT